MSENDTPLESVAAGPVARLGVIGDVHAEDERLAATLAFLVRAGVERTICTGDVADGQGSVDACCGMLAEHDVAVVTGNHERWMLADRMRHVPHAHQRVELSSDAIDFLSAQPSTFDLATVWGPLLLCHGVAGNDIRKVWPGSERLEPQRSPELDQLISEDRYRLLINGHTHFRMILEFHRLTLLNAGTLKRDARNSGFTIVDFPANEVCFFSFGDGAHIDRAETHPLRDPGSRRVWRDTQDFDSDWEVFRIT